MVRTACCSTSESPRRQQCLERAAIEKADDAALDQDSDHAGDDEGKRHGDQQRIVEQPRIAGADGFLHDECDISPDHDHLAMRHVDDAHDAEGDRQPNGRQQQHRTERHAVPGILHRRPHCEVALDRSRRIGGCARDRRRLLTAQPGQQRERLLIAARLDRGDGFKLFGISGVFLEQQDRGARLAECQLRAFVVFLLQRAVDCRQHGFVVRLENRLGGLDAFGWVQRLQRESTERGLHGAAQTIVKPHGGGTIGNDGDRRAGQGIAALAVGLADVDIFGVGIGGEPAILQRADDGVGTRIAAGRNRGDSLPGVQKFVVCEFRNRVFKRPGRDRQHGGEDQQRCKWERADLSAEPGEHWTTPAEADGRRRKSPPSWFLASSLNQEP